MRDAELRLSMLGSLDIILDFFDPLSFLTDSDLLHVDKSVLSQAEMRHQTNRLILGRLLTKRSNGCWLAGEGAASRRLGQYR